VLQTHRGTEVRHDEMYGVFPESIPPSSESLPPSGDLEGAAEQLSQHAGQRSTATSKAEQMANGQQVAAPEKNDIMAVVRSREGEVLLELTRREIEMFSGWQIRRTIQRALPRSNAELLFITNSGFHCLALTDNMLVEDIIQTRPCPLEITLMSRQDQPLNMFMPGMVDQQPPAEN